MSLKGQVALVTGASRGIGRGVAHQLGKAGVIVYISALKPEDEDPIVQSLQPKLPTLMQVAEEINSQGGTCIPIFCDHSDYKQVHALFERINFEQKGRLDILVNNAYSAVTTMLTKMHTKFFDLPEDIYDICCEVGLKGHYICARHAAKMMVKQGSGLIVEISSPGGINYIYNVAYGIQKSGSERLASDIAVELKEFNVTSVCLVPGPVKSELYSDEIGMVRKEKAQVVSTYANGETIEFSGKCVAALASDPKLIEKTGQILLTMELAKEYNLKDEDGRQPICPIASKYLDYIHEVNRVRSQTSL